MGGGPEWWNKFRAKLRPGTKSSRNEEVAPSAPSVLPLPSAPSAPGYNANAVDAMGLGDDFEMQRMQDALASAAPSEPASQASSVNQGGLFGHGASMGAGLLPRMAQPASGQSYFLGESVPLLAGAAPAGMDPSFEMHSQDGRPYAGMVDGAGAAQPVQPVANQAPTPAEAQPKLTAAALGTHVTLSEGVARQHRGHRKMHFIKNWLHDAEADATDTPTSAAAASAATVPPGDGVNSDYSRVDSQAGGMQLVPTGLVHAAEARDSASASMSSPLGRAKHPHLDSPVGKSHASPYTIAKTMASLDNARSLRESSVSSALGATGTPAIVMSHQMGSRDSSNLAAPNQPSLLPLGSLEGPMLAAAHNQHHQGVIPPVVPSAALLAQAAGTAPAMQPELLSPSQQMLQQQLQMRSSLHRNSLRRAASHNAAAFMGGGLPPPPRDSGAGTGAPGLVQRDSEGHEKEGMGAGGRWQSRPESGGLENYLASAVTTMTVTSQVEGPEIPKRVAVPSMCSAAISSPNTRPGDQPPLPPPAALRLPSASSHESTKTIAVAGHCPEDIAAQQWSVDDFVLQRKLYEGALSVICHAQHKKSGRHVALKIYKRSRLHEMERFQLAREICLHIRILHPHILSLYAAWKDSKYVYLVLEWAPHGNLFELLVSRGGKLPEVEAARHIIRPLLSSLAFLHSHSWLHRDVKLENVLLDAQGMVKMCDFGLAIDQKFEQANTRLGTFGYFAPEVLDCPLKKGPFDFKGEPGVPTYGCKVDVWSMGVMSYELLTGKAPFAASSAAKIIDAIRSRDIVYPVSLSAGARDFLATALVRDPETRATADQLLQHPWILACCGAAGAGAGPAV